MAMFAEKKPLAEGPGTIVGSNVRLSGVLRDTNDITVHGCVEGEVISEKNISVEKNAQIKGPVNAQTIIVAGKIHGEVKAGERLEILETGRVSGSISTKDLVIKSGAQFNGKCKMGEPEKKVEEKKVVAVKPTKSIPPKKQENEEIQRPPIKPEKKYELE